MCVKIFLPIVYSFLVLTVFYSGNKNLCSVVLYEIEKISISIFFTVEIKFMFCRLCMSIKRTCVYIFRVKVFSFKVLY
jgi:hypothetical protein